MWICASLIIQWMFYHTWWMADFVVQWWWNLEIAGLLGADAQTLELAILFIAQKLIQIVFV
jgi:hypothetical protein